MPRPKSYDKWLASLPAKVRSKIAKNVTIHSVEKTRFGTRIEGENPYQDFVEYWDAKGNVRGMILRVKGEDFWSVWKGRLIVTVPIKKPGYSVVVGSKRKSIALQRLHEILKGS